MTKNKSALDRVRRVLASDKINMSGYRIAELIKSDMVGILNNYMELERLELNINYDEEGRCYVTVSATADRLKGLNILP